MKLTELAINKVKEMAKKEDLANYGLRIAIVGGGCSGYSYDMELDESERLDDFVFVHNGLKVFVDPMSFQFLDGTTVDYIESFKYSGFNFQNPNAEKTCGCGSSFAV